MLLSFYFKMILLWIEFLTCFSIDSLSGPAALWCNTKWARLDLYATITDLPVLKKTL